MNYYHNNHFNDLHLASWKERSLAWIIDVLIVFLGIAILFVIFIIIPTLMLYPTDISEIFEDLQIYHFILLDLFLFIYWIYCESTTGQSIGKRVMRIKITDLEGKPANMKNVAIEAFGKSFLSLLDVVLGWLFANDKRQRIFNKLSNTIVIRVN